MTEYVISYAQRGSKSRHFYDRTFLTLEKAKSTVKSFIAERYYHDFVIAELVPMLTVKLPEPTWVEIKKETSTTEKPVVKVNSK